MAVSGRARRRTLAAMNFVLIVILVGCVAVATADGYQAVTGRRLSKKPSRRTDQEMRRHLPLPRGCWGP